MSLPNLAALPAVSFAPGDAADVEAAVIGTYERLAGVTLQPADPVRLFLESLAYVLCVQNNVIDLAGRQNLLAYAQGAHLDHLGALMGVTRIPAQPARCVLRFSVGEALGFGLPIPAGTRVSTQDGKIAFSTGLAAEIPAGELAVDVAARASEAGLAASGLVAGQVCRLVDPLPHIVSAVNVTTTAEGADVEDDERLRERIRLAPESYTVAGSAGQYEARVLEVSADILAVSVHTPEPGVVDVRFVLAGGELPDADMVALVSDHLNAETVRPLTDKVLVATPDVLVFPDERVAHANSAKHHAAGMAASREQFLKLPASLRHMEWLYWNRQKEALNYIIPDDEPGWCLVVPVEWPGNPGRKADGLGVIVNAYRMERKKIEGQLVPLLKKE